MGASKKVCSKLPSLNDSGSVTLSAWSATELSGSPRRALYRKSPAREWPSDASKARTMWRAPMWVLTCTRLRFSDRHSRLTCRNSSLGCRCIVTDPLVLPRGIHPSRSCHSSAKSTRGCSNTHRYVFSTLCFFHICVTLDAALEVLARSMTPEQGWSIRCSGIRKLFSEPPPNFRAIKWSSRDFSGVDFVGMDDQPGALFTTRRWLLENRTEGGGSNRRIIDIFSVSSTCIQTAFSFCFITWNLWYYYYYVVGFSSEWICWLVHPSRLLVTSHEYQELTSFVTPSHESSHEYQEKRNRAKRRKGPGICISNFTWHSYA